MESPVTPATRPAQRLGSKISNTTRGTGRPRRFLRRGARHGAAFFMTIIAAGIIYSASFVAPARSADAPQRAARSRTDAGRKSSARQTAPAAAARNSSGPAFSFMPLFQVGEESITTYAADCTTPKTAFVLGDTVCAKVENAPQPPRATRPLRRFSWVGTANTKRQQTTINATSQTDTFVLPTTSTSLIGGVLVDNRGDWVVVTTDTADGSSRVKAVFSVQDPQQPAANLSVNNFHVDGGEIVAGQNAVFRVSVVNRGPDAAAGVELKAAVPASTTFASAVQVSGPSFTCANPSAGATGDSTCTIASLPARSVSVFTFSYETGSVSPGQIVTSTAQATSTTDDPRPLDNSSSASAKVPLTPSSQCALECPNDIVVPANTTDENNQPGAVVTFGSAEPFGSCGTVTSSHPSGSFFPVGTTVVTSNSSTGGGACSFNVTVIESVNPIINCADDITVPESSQSSNSAIVTYTVTATDNDGAPDVACSHPSGSRFEVGTTNVVCTATDSSGNTASCDFDVTVTETNDGGCELGTTPPTPKVATLPMITRACSATLLVADDPNATDSCGNTISGETGERHFDTPGDHTVTWTYTDGAGNVSTQTQVVRILPDNQAPVPDAPSLPTVTGECSATLGETPTASDNCAGLEVQGVALDPLTYNTPGTHTVRWQFSDPAGNTTIQTQTVVVTDGAAPVPNVASLPTLSGECSVTAVAPTASDNCAGTVTATTSDPTTYTAQGTYIIHWTYTDLGGNTATQNQTVVVDDNTPPTISAPAAATLYTGPGAVSCGVTVADLDAALGTATANDNCAGVSVVRTGVPAGGFFPLGQTTVTYTATDVGGNSTSATQVVNVVDNTAPTISAPNVVVNLPLNSPATSMAVTYPAATTSDNCAGAVSVVYSPASGSVFPVGTSTVTATATDAHGNTKAVQFTVTVLYNFTGFFSPVSNPPTLNSVNAGRAIPVKFSLSGNKGLGIMAAGYPASQQVACDNSAPLSELEGTETSGGSTLTYSPDQYHYNWKTEKGWEGTCRVLVVKLNDGTEHTALFKFK
jgi:hypothetical protein